MSLVERFREGDDEAARQLYEQFSAEMLRLVRRKLWGVANRAGFDSEGLVISGFRSWFSELRKPTFDESQSRIGGLLARIVYCKCCVALRRKRKTLSFGPEELGAIVEAVMASSAGSESLQEIATQWDELMDHIVSEMTPREQSILACYLDESDERSRDEIAVACKCSLAAVDMAIERFEHALRARLRECGPDVEAG